jgi:4-hydroxythreonine-4-phosphate dehydrogenase
LTPRVAVTLGDPRGIGPEIAARALSDPVDADVVVIGAEDQIASVPAVDRVSTGSWRAHEVDEGAGRVIRAGRITGHAVEHAVKLALAGEVDAIVTGPAHKHALHLAGFPYPGHTEWLAELAGGVDVAMMLAADPLRVVLVTTHVPLRDVPALITTEHAGEEGLFGDEDDRVLRPAAEQLGAAGPLPADTVFVRALRGEFDAVITPYHDVGMTAVKVAGFGRGVNVTLGLPFPRTAPDHGTAFDIAGTGTADPGSMRAAIELAIHLAARSSARA